MNPLATTATAPERPLAPPPVGDPIDSLGSVDPALARRAYVAAGLGWTLDGMTWTLYSFAITVAGASFGLSAAGAISAFGWITAASVVSSAVGGVVGGVLADRHGRAKVLVWTIVGYSVFTALTATAGSLGQMLLWRILEGFTFGAEWAVGAALVAEYAPAARRGLMSALVHTGYSWGWAISTVVYLVLFQTVDHDVAWRLLFLVGLLPALLAVWVRFGVRDRVPATGWGSPPAFGQLFRGGRAKTTVLCTLVGAGAQGIFYSAFVFMPIYLARVRHLPISTNAQAIFSLIAGGILGIAAAGWLHDWIGRRLTFTVFFAMTAVVLAAVIAMPSDDHAIFFAALGVLGFFGAGQSGGLGAYFAEHFPTAMRATGQAFSYNVGRAIAALGPVTIGSSSAGIGLGAVILIIGVSASVLALAALWWLPETRAAEIIEQPGPSAAPIVSGTAGESAR
jgi:MFS family permease